ncbi:nucleic acid-binding, OB-fold-like protein [Tanacetum coccineum]|uniref:Nucleic acid-binding, OB-fold-like protein n=1 Tax=Tanacetum coccineum TaxID=301880 RepID=A0ABQ5AW75_9ASTR
MKKKKNGRNACYSGDVEGEDNETLRCRSDSVWDKAFGESEMQMNMKMIKTMKDDEFDQLLLLWRPTKHTIFVDFLDTKHGRCIVALLLSGDFGTTAWNSRQFGTEIRNVECVEATVHNKESLFKRDDLLLAILGQTELSEKNAASGKEQVLITPLSISAGVQWAQILVGCRMHNPIGNLILEDALRRYRKEYHRNMCGWENVPVHANIVMRYSGTLKSLPILHEPHFPIEVALFSLLGIQFQVHAFTRKPVFTKVDNLRPGTSGHNLIVKVVSAKLVLQKGNPDNRQMGIAECLVREDWDYTIYNEEQSR